MLTTLLSGYPPWLVLGISLGLALVMAFFGAELLARVLKAALRRLLARPETAAVAETLRRPVRVARWLAFAAFSVLLAVPAVELAGYHTTFDLHPEAVLDWAVTSGLRILLITSLAWLLVRVVDIVVNRLEYEASQGLGIGSAERAKRVRTLGNLVEYVVAVFVTGAATLMVLRELHLDITPVLAGAGVVGLAVSFGAQSIVKDFFTGFFLILEDQVRVGDVAVINGTAGLVESITLRRITVRDAEGTVHVFPNGSIATLANRTKDYSYALVDVGVSYREDTDRVSQVLREVGADLASEPAFRDAVLEPLEVLGVEQFTDSAVVLRTRFKTRPQRQWDVARELRRRIKRRFDAEGIEIPGRQLALVRRPRSAGAPGGQGPLG